MRLTFFCCLILVLVGSMPALAQTCTASASGTVNLTSLSWTGASGVSNATCANIAAGTDVTTVANFFVGLANNTNINITNNVFIHGSFDIPSGATGDGSVITVSGSHSMHITVDLGDNSNNGITWSVPTTNDHITVDGTLYGKNTNAFTGSGTITGGTLNIKNGATCGTPCPVSGGFTACTSDNGGNTFCDNNNVLLPISLTGFTASSIEQGVKLDWSTALEVNFNYFQIEKSTSGEDFSVLAKVVGHGTSFETNYYSHIDQHPSIGKNYYRLKSIDFDGYAETFKVISINYITEKGFIVSPNPTGGNAINFKLNFLPQGEFIIAIYDNVGNVIDRIRLSNPDQTILFNSSLSSGVYFAKLITEDFVRIERFIVK